MGITYNKQTTKKDRLQPGLGPRDRQQRQQAMGAPGFDPALVNELKSQIRILQEQLAARPSGENGYTASQVNEEIEKAILAELKTIREEHKVEVDKLNKKISDLNKKYEQASASEKASKDLINSMQMQINARDSELALLRDKLANKEELIQQLKETKATDTVMSMDDLRKALDTATKELAAQMKGEVVKDPDRPEMEEVFVDPLEEGAGNGVDATNVKVENVSLSDKETAADKVAKLKKLMGNLPKRPI